MTSTLYVLDAVFPTEPALQGQRPIKFAVLFFLFELCQDVVQTLM